MHEFNPEHSKLIDRYLLNQLTMAEQTVFNDLIKNDAFSEELGFRKALREVSERKGDERLYAMLEEESRRMDKEKPRRKLLPYLLGLALLIVVGFCCFWIYNKTNKLSPQQLYMAHYETFTNLIAPTERSDESLLAGKQLALHAYDTRDFTKAISIFDTMSMMDDDLMIYYAISSLESGQSDKAKKLLQILSNNDNAQFQEAAQWYLCLLFLKEGDEQYEQQLNKITSNLGHRYYAKALSLKDDLR